jgi:lipoprotein-releasing system permease protein
MSLSRELAWRYSFGVKRQGFARLVSLVSIFGMGLGVAILVVVLSVMNGFSREITDRVLAVVPHVMVSNLSASGLESIAAAPEVIAYSPIVTGQVLFQANGSLTGGRVHGVDTATFASVSPWLKGLTEHLVQADQQRYAVVLSESLASRLAVQPGDRIKVTLPSLALSPFGVFPRSRSLTVVQLFSPGLNQSGPDAFVSLDSAEHLFQDTPRTWQIRLEDLWQSTKVAGVWRDAPAFADATVVDWTESQGSLFASIRMEKRMVASLLFFLVIVAAFNLIATLAMSVQSRRKDIAVLGMMGLGRQDLVKVFLWQGLFMSGVAIVVGLVAGSALAIFMPQVVAGIELLVGVKLFDPSVYFISDLPSQLKASDVAIVGFTAFLLSALASYYPALRASRIMPAEVLRYE